MTLEVPTPSVEPEQPPLPPLGPTWPQVGPCRLKVAPSRTQVAPCWPQVGPPPQLPPSATHVEEKPPEEVAGDKFLQEEAQTLEGRVDEVQPATLKQARQGLAHAQQTLNLVEQVQQRLLNTAMTVQGDMARDMPAQS